MTFKDLTAKIFTWQTSVLDFCCLIIIKFLNQFQDKCVFNSYIIGTWLFMFVQ